MSFVRSRPVDAALLALAVVVLVTSVPASLPHVRYASTIVAVALVVLLARNRRPPAAAVVSFVLLGVGGHVALQITGAMFVSILVCFGVAGTLPSRRTAVVAWAVGCAAMGAGMAGNPYVEGAGDVALTLTFCTLVWCAGLLAADRGRAAGEARARAELVELSRDVDVASATAHERARIAGELHDIVSHGLSIVILQTLAARMALQDEEVVHDSAVDSRLAAVEATARDALSDMRRLLDLLQPAASEVGDDATGPSVGLDQLPGLVEQARAAGLGLELDVQREGPALPAGLDAAAYRIVQEAITNVLKHAPGAPTQVRVWQRHAALEISVHNATGRASEGAVRGAGYGLIGMRQRTELYGGTLTAGSQGDGFCVQASFALEQVR